MKKKIIKLLEKKLNKKIVKIFDISECQKIINDIEINKKHLKISTEHGVERISSYEIDYKNLSKEIKKLIDQKIKDIIRPLTKCKKGMIFGVKYSLETKSYMEEHYDCNTFSCVINLNNNFKDGGTFFPFSGEIIKTEVGYGCLFRADTLNSYHSAHPISDGVRYVLVIRMEKNNPFFVFLKALFLHFVDKYIRKNKKNLFKEPFSVNFEESTNPS